MTFGESPVDTFAAGVSRLSDAGVQLDETEQLLLALERAGIVNETRFRPSCRLPSATPCLMPFDPFGDFATRGYSRNFAGEKDPEAVKHLDHRVFAAHVRAALEYLKTQASLRYEHLLETHRILFGAMYPWAGQDRAALAPELAIGKGGAFDPFAHPGDVRRAVEYGLEMGRDPHAMREKPGEVLGTLAYAHPLLENNGRTIITVHTDMARRAGFHIAWHEIAKKPFLEALTAELRQPGSALDALVAPHIRGGPPDLSTTAAQLAANQGINPVSASAVARPGPG